MIINVYQSDFKTCCEKILAKIIRFSIKGRYCNNKNNKVENYNIMR